MQTSNIAPPIVQPVKDISYRKQKRTVSIIINIIMIIVALTMILPFWLVISVSLTDEKALAVSGYRMSPSVFSTFAYEYLFKVPALIQRAYGVTSFITLFGTGIGLLVMSMFGYGLARITGKTQRIVALYVLFTILFKGGLIPFYLLMTKVYGLKNSIIALIFPYLVSPFNVLLLRSFFSQLPSEILESAKIDGANELRIFFKIALPLSTPALATIGLFTLLGYWNDYYLALLFIDNPDFYPLQYLLFNMMNNADAITKAAAVGVKIIAPIHPLRMAMAVLAAGPAVFISLTLGRYLVRGITLGGVKA